MLSLLKRACRYWLLSKPSSGLAIKHRDELAMDHGGKEYPNQLDKTLGFLVGSGLNLIAKIYYAIKTFLTNFRHK